MKQKEKFILEKLLKWSWMLLKWSWIRGLLAREPCVKMKVSLADIKLHEDAIHSGPAQVYPAVREAITEAMKKADASFLSLYRFML